MKLKSVGSEQFKLIDQILPFLSDGEYKAWVSQDITIGEGDDQTVETFQKETEFCVAGRAFTLQPDSVFSVSPNENAVGNFSNELPFIVLNLKSLPWQYRLGNSSKTPWVALIVLSEDEGAVERDMKVGELLSDEKNRGIYFPIQKQPEHYMENSEDICHVVELSREIYEKIMPAMEELLYLCHAKYVNLSKTEESVSAKDGYFSVIIGNRFLPSEDERPVKSTVHLVSLLGYDSRDFSDCHTIRLCSLYHWNVFSQSSGEAGFGQLIDGMDCRQFPGVDTENELRKRGVVAREHRFRTGEISASLYCSPLLPAKAPVLSMTSRRTADGHLIYDKEKGIFDTKYACAWQLGRMLTLSNEAMALKIHQWRRHLAEAAHRNLLQRHTEKRRPDLENICRTLTQVLGRRR